MANARPVAPPPSSGTSAVKIILIIVAIFVGLGIIGVGAFGFMAWRIARSVHVSGPNGEVSVSTPGGTITANPNERYSASDLGTDIYPGAQSAKGGMRLTLPTGSSVTAVFVTPDSKDQASIFDSANSAMLTVEKSKQETVMVTVTPNSSQHDGKTQITIIHTTSTKGS
jgi:nitrate reductase NapE component